jgi:BolA protein
MASRPIHQSINQKITQSLTPASLTVTDESHMHRGHAGVRDASSPETHFSIEVVSEKFDGLNRVQRQRLVNDLLKEEFSRGLHALSLRCNTPSEQ